MKKLWVLFLSLFLVFGIVSCKNDNPTETEIEYNLNEQLEVPSNLRVNESTKTLTWDAVENAVRYNVYVDGELEDEVTTTSFDFSGVAGSKLIFTVKAMAPKGMQNSNLSTTIAYVANRESEISKMKLSIQASNMTVNDEDAFATELVNKGMLSEDFDAMMAEMEDMESVMELNDMTDIYTEFDQLLDSMDLAMIEAFISSLIKVELKTVLQWQLDYYYEQEYYWEESIEQYETLLDLIDDKGDEAVKSAMIVIEYLMDVQNGINTELVENMETIVNSNELTSANIGMLVNVKNDLVTNLKDNLPELEDVIVLNSTMLAFMEVMSEEAFDISNISIPKQSAQSLMSMELFFNFILGMDEDYISAFVDANNSMDPEGTKPFVKENIKLIDQYLDDNEELIEQLNNIYTDEEKETVFYEYYIQSMVGSYYSMMFGYPNATGSVNEEMEAIIREQIDFDNIMLLQETMGENLNVLLDAIIESDYAVIDAFYQVAAMSNSTGFIQSNDDFGGSLDFGIVTYLQPGEYRVTVSGFSSYEEGPYEFYIYADYGQGEELIQSTSDVLIANVANVYTFTLTEPATIRTNTVSNLDTYGTLEKIQDNSQDQMTEAEAVGILLDESLALFNPIIQDTTLEEYNALIDLMFGQLIIQYEMQSNVSEYEYNRYTDILAIIGYIETGVKNTAANHLNIFKDLVDLLAETDYIDEIIELRGNANDEYGTEEYWGSIILMANAYLDFYNDNENDINAIIDEFMVVLREPDVRVELDLTTSDLAEIETAINDHFTDLTAQANLVKDYDYTNLTSTQEANLEAFISTFLGFIFMV